MSSREQQGAIDSLLEVMKDTVSTYGHQMEFYNKPYVIIWKDMFPLISELGYNMGVGGTAWLRYDEYAAPVIIAAESYLAAHVQNEDVEHVKSILVEKLFG